VLLPVYCAFTFAELAMGGGSPTFEPGSLIKLLVPKQPPSKPSADANDREDDDTDEPAYDDFASRSGGSVHKTDWTKSRSPPRAGRRPVAAPAQRRLRGSIAEKIGNAGPPPRPVPLNIDALKASRQKNKLANASTASLPLPTAVWERAVDDRRNAVYYWEHLSRRASWQSPSMLDGWWERLFDENSGCEFFWNSATQKTVWHLPVSDVMPAVQPAPALLQPYAQAAPVSAEGLDAVLLTGQGAPPQQDLHSQDSSQGVDVPCAVAGFARSGLLSTGSEFSDTGGVKIESVELDIVPLDGDEVMAM